MPLNDAKLISDLEDLYKYMAIVEDPEQARLEFATRQAAIISAYVRSGVVITTGTAATQTGAIT